MSSLIFAHAKSIVRKAKREARTAANNYENMTGENIYPTLYEQQLNWAFTEFQEILEVSKKLHTKYVDFCSPQNNKGFFITIRPDCEKIDFESFQAKCLEYVKRKCFIDYHLSFEQKGTSDETLGSGFHCHIVAKMKQRSKTEVLRDTLSSWNSWIEDKYIAANCIEVHTTSNMDTLVQRYLIDYDADDGHKAVTKDWDTKWREANGIPAMLSSTGEF